MFKRKKVEITFTEQYLHALNQLVEKGIYLNRSETIMAALRHFFRHHKIEPFYTELAEEVEKLHE